MKMFYLAAPYSDPDDQVIRDRVSLFCQIDERLMRAGHHTVSPLYKHLLFENGARLPSDWAYWAEYSKNLMARCDAVVVFCLDGWKTSQGVQAEIAEAERLKKPIHWIYARVYHKFIALRVNEISEADQMYDKARRAERLQDYRAADSYQAQAMKLLNDEEKEALVL